MATRNSTSKAKTKITKKPAVKARSAAAKTTRATKSTKVTKSTKTTKSVKKTKVTVFTFATLRKLHLIKAVIATALAVSAGFLMNNSSYSANIGYQAKDELLSLTTGKTAFVHASQSLFDIQIRWMVVAILAISATASLLVATRMKNKYEKAIANKVVPARWISMGIIVALMVEVTALLSGVSDIATLKLLAGLVLITCALGWVTEKRLKQSGRPVWSEFVLSIITGALPWLLIGSYAVSTWMYGLIRYPWFVYALLGSTLIGFSLLAYNQYKYISGWKNYLIVERNYLLIGTATQVAFAAILILGLQR